MLVVARNISTSVEAVNCDLYKCKELGQGASEAVRDSGPALAQGLRLRALRPQGLEAEGIVALGEAGA
jgi:hypothetical protein